MHAPDPDTGLSSFVTVLAGELPGTWTINYQPDHDSVTAQIWDMNEVAEATARNTVNHCAVLTRDDGTRLLIADPIGLGKSYLIAAMAPQDLPVEAFRGVREPDGISVAADPFSAAEDVMLSLLPRYDNALAQVRHNAARLTAAEASGPEHIVLTWSGDAIVADKPARPDIAQTLGEHGFAFDTDRDLFVLSGDDSARQAASVRAAGQRLAEQGIGVILRHPGNRPALHAAAPTQPTSAVKAPQRNR